MTEFVKRSLRPYLVATLALAVAISISLGAKSFRSRGSFLLLLSAVAISSWYGGIGPGLFAIVVSAVFAAWVVLPPSDSVRIDSWMDAFRLILFVLVSLLISSLHSARKRAERSLRETEQRLGFALISAGVGCWDADVAAGTFWRSANLHAIYGRDSASFATTYEGFFAYIHPEDRDFVQLATTHANNEGADYEIAHRIICPDGTIRRVNTRGRMILDNEGKVSRMVGTVFALDKPPQSQQPASSTVSSAAMAHA